MKNKKLFYPLENIDIIKPILNKISIFGGLKEFQINFISNHLHKTSYYQDEIIFKEKSSPTHIYIIIRGKVKLVHEVNGINLEIIEYSVGNCFGETALIGIQPHSATAIAVENCELLILSKKTLMELFKIDKEIFGLIVLNIAREACRRLSKTDNILLHYVLSTNKI